MGASHFVVHLEGPTKSIYHIVQGVFLITGQLLNDVIKYSRCNSLDKYCINYIGFLSVCMRVCVRACGRACMCVHVCIFYWIF